ncbi:MAG: potassium channel family protein [Alphaproteobacteria bacterium]|nr:potassium channel family protein [Alphaproteobacteria bacterium]
MILTAGVIALKIRYLKDHGAAFTRYDGFFRDSLVLGFVLLGMSGALGVSVSLWTALFIAIDAFASVEEALYFAMVTFTTLGFGDILMPDEWRLLAGFAASNGMVFFGLITATLFEVFRRLINHRES